MGLFDSTITRNQNGAIPLRVQIAMQILTGTKGVQGAENEFARNALALADALVEEHNKTCDEKKDK